MFAGSAGLGRLGAMTTTDLPGFNANGTAATDDGIIDLRPPEDQRKPKRFRLGDQPDDVYTAAARVPVLISAQFAKGMLSLRDSGAGEIEALEGIVELLRQVLWPEDVDRFVERCRDIKRPVDHRQLMQLVDRLMGEWGLGRPQTPPEPSSGGEPSLAPGSSSEAEPPPAVSPSNVSTPTGSATSSTPSWPTGPTPPTSTPPASAPNPSPTG